MSFNEVIAELPSLTFEERQILIRRYWMIRLCRQPMKNWMKRAWRRISPIRHHQYHWLR
jgi:hypothetical protein